MSSLILHHYTLSPYSEKIRAMLGYTQLPWHEVIVKEMPPRPTLDLLAGGYQRIPVAQIGADIFCDTAIISDEIARISQLPQLGPGQCEARCAEFAREVEEQVFFAAVVTAASWKLARRVLKGLSFPEWFQLLKDRANMTRQGNIKTVTRREAREILEQHLLRMEFMLEQDFLFGDSPSIADFASYHCLWFVRDVGGRKILNNYPKTLQWMQRIQAFGHGAFSRLSDADALAIARENEPRSIANTEQQDDAIGATVTITPTDYRCTPSRGLLVGATSCRWVIARETPQTGRVHVHFPRRGFELVVTTNTP